MNLAVYEMTCEADIDIADSAGNQAVARAHLAGKTMVWRRRAVRRLASGHRRKRDRRRKTADQMGCMRHFRLQGGRESRERLPGLSNRDHSRFENQVLVAGLVIPGTT